MTGRLRHGAAPSGRWQLKRMPTKKSARTLVGRPGLDHNVGSGPRLWPGGSQAWRGQAEEDGRTAYSHPLVTVGPRGRRQ